MTKQEVTRITTKPKPEVHYKTIKMAEFNGSIGLRADKSPSSVWNGVGKRLIPAVVSAVLRQPGWEFVNPESCSPSPVWPHSCADYFPIKRVLGMQRKPSWFVTEVH